MLGVLLRAYADQLGDAANKLILQNSLFSAQLEAVQDTRLGSLMRAALLYKLLVIVAVTCMLVAMYALAATYKQMVQDILSRLMDSLALAVVEPDADGAWLADPRRSPPQVRFNDSVAVTSTYSPAEYDRREARQRLSPKMLIEARDFLVEYKKNEMRVHPASEENTHVFKLR